MKFTNKEVLIFDLDGTLIDSVPDLALSTNLMLEALDKPTYPVDTIRSWVGNGASVLTQRALSGSIDISPDLDPLFVEKALSIFLDFYKQNVCVNTCVYPNVKTTLQDLKELGYRLVIVTNKPEQFIAPILQKLGLANLFEMLVGGDTLPKRKPDPMQLEYVCNKLGVSATDCVMIGDSKNDIYAATAANMQSIGLTYGYNHGEDISTQGANLVLDDFADILSAMISTADAC
ncbi:phosphoglycolate phosphatase [Saccharobesus litoralis]|uniref:Phosphoglycolate phosphatase n=1 Tax=Saccharobesus litoralis TaxID=2172099 RepID=A0A2S0VXG2_9ALTE|nr:phosphoglycolate phosphatase [Saccharobesus litoralis]AWB68865.1 phosphoglycolate phosphatase [Saccharobesus litoralis]